jgi:hypothetical protein
MKQEGKPMHFLVRRWHFGIVAFLALGAQTVSAQGLITFVDPTPGNGTVTDSYAPITPYSNTGFCQTFSGTYDLCAGVYFDEPSFGGAAASVDILDDFTGANTIFAYAGQGDATPRVGDNYSDPLSAGGENIGVNIDFGWSGTDPNNGEPILGISFFEEQSFPVDYVGNCILEGPCAGAVTGGVQEAFTIDYLDANGNVLGTDQIDFEGEGSPTPEPCSALLIFSGLGLLAAGCFIKRARYAGRPEV